MNPILRIAGRSSAIADDLTVLRALPSRQRRMVGAWCFLDHLGPVAFAAERGMHVGAHPHTALQTFTWLIEGEVLHRDSLGSEQVIRPGQVNLMTAGRGVVHTEDSLRPGQRLHAAQLWIALPPEVADCAPEFAHFPVLPCWEENGCTLTLIAGDYAGHHMPGRFHTPLVGLDLLAKRATRLTLPLEPGFEYGLLVLEGSVNLGGERFAGNEFAWLGSGADQLALELAAGTRLLLLGGAPFGEPVLMWWNFVGHSREAIAAAQRDWETGSPRFGPVPGDGGRRLVAPPLPWPAPPAGAAG
ncbi:MAG TPA: pirin family protein [Azonexus sp.]